jgi:hypothetical protein
LHWASLAAQQAKEWDLSPAGFLTRPWRSDAVSWITLAHPLGLRDSAHRWAEITADGVSILAIERFGRPNFAFELRIGCAQAQRALGHEGKKHRIAFARTQVVEGFLGQNETNGNTSFAESESEHHKSL